MQAGRAHRGVPDPARADGRVLRRDGALGARRAVRRAPRAGVRPPRARRRRRRGRALHLPRELRHHAREYTTKLIRVLLLIKQPLIYEYIP